MSNTRRARFVRTLGAAAAVACAAYCAPAPPPPPPSPEPLPVEGNLDVQSAARWIAQDIARQFGATAGARTLVIDPLLDRVSGQQTGVTVRFETELGPALSAHVPALTLHRFDAEGAAHSRYVLAGAVAASDAPDSYSITASVSDRETGIVVARSTASFVQAGLDGTPTRFYSESPSIIRDSSVEGYLRTVYTEPGGRADEHYVSQIMTSALLAQALAAYNAEQWEAALTGYLAAAQRPDGQQARTYTGLYLTNLRLRRLREAEEAFGRVAALGLATKSFSVKMLFRANSSTEFWPGADFAGVYPMWIRQIARAVQTAGVCLNIVGHTSRTGTEAVNDRISVARAETVKRLLEAQVRTLAPRLLATGVGFRENLVGSGTDDARDAIDRRVEFKVVDCPSR